MNDPVEGPRASAGTDLPGGRGRPIPAAFAIALALLALIVVAWNVLGSGERSGVRPGPGEENSSERSTEPRSPTSNLGLPGLQTHPPPWHAGHDGLLARLERLELPPARREGSAVDLEARLEVTVNEQPMEVPAGVGTHGQARAPLHTHGADGTIHVASSVVRDYTLGQFFDVWGLRFGRGCIGPLCSDDLYELRVLEDGQPVRGDPRALELRDRQQITVEFGPRAR